MSKLTGLYSEQGEYLYERSYSFDIEGQNETCFYKKLNWMSMKFLPELALETPET